MERVRVICSYGARLYVVALVLAQGCGGSNAAAHGETSASTRVSAPANSQWTEEDQRVFRSIASPSDPGGAADVGHLQPAELQRIATAIRVMRMAPHPALQAERRALLLWLIETHQVGITVCSSLVSTLGIHSEGSPYLPEFLLQLGASVIELSPGLGVNVDVVEANTRAVSAFADYYRAALLQGAPHDADLDALVALSENGGLPARVAEVSASCEEAGLVRF